MNYYLVKYTRSYQEPVPRKRFTSDPDDPYSHVLMTQPIREGYWEKWKPQVIPVNDIVTASEIIIEDLNDRNMIRAEFRPRVEEAYLVFMNYNDNINVISPTIGEISYYLLNVPTGKVVYLYSQDIGIDTAYEVIDSSKVLDLSDAVEMSLAGPGFKSIAM